MLTNIQSAPYALPQQHADQDLVLQIRDVGKMYRIYEQPQDRLKQMLLWRFGRSYGHEFWALKHVNLNVCRGETIGIIGRNGSGKSTLLQIIAGTLAPSTGSIATRGRVAALLELGSGFNPEFTGRENIYLNGSILGMSRQEIDQRFEEIAAFADIGEFIEQPVKFYSSGMFVRLAFAVQANIEPDIFIVDEALAVGDIFFSQKCYRRLEWLRQRGTAIILVTHNMGDVRQYCQRALVLNNGHVAFEGPATDAIAQYLLYQQPEQRTVVRGNTQSSMGTSREDTNQEQILPSDQAAYYDISALPQVSNGAARCTAVALCNAQGQAARVFEQGEQASLFYEFEILEDIEVPLGGFNIENINSVLVHGRNSLQYSDEAVVKVARAGVRVQFRYDILLNLAIGHYTFEVGLAGIHADDFEQRTHFTPPELYARVTRLCHVNPVGSFQVINKRYDGVEQHSFFGVADLPSTQGAIYVGTLDTKK